MLHNCIGLDVIDRCIKADERKEKASGEKRESRFLEGCQFQESAPLFWKDSNTHEAERQGECRQGHESITRVAHAKPIRGWSL